MMYGSLTRQFVALLAAIGIAQTCAAQAAGNPAADPQALAGTWIPTGNLQIARSKHTATLLASGKVLVVGGYGSNGYLASTELYDPATGTWGPVGDMNVPRALHTATLLSNGKVLVVGGDESTYFGRTNTAELYDPTIGTWSFTGSPSAIYSVHTATLLQNGKVLVAGGFNKTAELYDPVTGTWSLTGSLKQARYGHTATLLQDGRVLVARGSDDGDLTYTLASAELYDPVVGTWSTTANAAATSVFHSATLLPNGRVLVAGGYAGGIGGGETWAGAELYDPATQTWSGTGGLATRRYGHAAILLATGEILATGGGNTEDSYPNLKYNNLASVERYDSNAGAWVSVDSLSAARAHHTATLLRSGQVLVVGGNIVGPHYSTMPLDSAELYATAAASSPYRITALFSDQAGVYQYILLQSLGPTSGSVFGLTLAVTSRTGIVRQFTFPSYPSQSNSPLCIATHSAWPILDFIVPDQFLPTDGGTISLVGVDSWTFGPLPTDGHSSLQRSSGVSGTALMQCSHFAAVLNVPIDPVIEYYNATLDHYFISASQPDLDALDSGRSAGWQRTGSSFPAWITRNVGPLGGFVVPAGLRDVCRIYIPPNKGDSHFFSASAGECAASLAQHPDFVLETNAAFLATLPDAATGACPSGQVPVYRLWNNRVDSNHRYTTSLTVRGEMISRGYIAEGYGPNAVALCVGGNL